MFNNILDFFRRNKINIISPKRFQEVDSNFIISGEVPISWLHWNEWQEVYEFSFNILNINGYVNGWETISIPKEWRDEAVESGKKKVCFVYDYTLGQDADRLNFSKGRINLWFGESLIIPIIVSKYKQDLPKGDKAIWLHANLHKVIKRYRRDLRKISGRLAEIENRRYERYVERQKELENFVEIDDALAQDVFNILNSEKGVNKKYPPIKDLIEERKIRTKYADAINWSKSLGDKGGGAGMMNGFLFIVHSNDHDKHFHAVHKEKGIDARFSYPEIQLINYKNEKNYISSKVRKEIRKYFQDPAHFKKLTDEFNRRDGTK